VPTLSAAYVYTDRLEPLIRFIMLAIEGSRSCIQVKQWLLRRLMGAHRMRTHQPGHRSP
jgi:hypothetical protein